ncbi:tetratricopeptide repeat protein [Micromonospora sp. RHAY321]|uniref:tetratricopeptide repeat protein n=1 Tax=Micromonospora sp. RHAY321 TaxID=2944807 RepID=UPI00207CAAC5|nr:tetratricopeptide repeat protein [Micromonospora sp. RHAY321]MCO1594234.1 tetratricopeptide repeat protein [Micromonospora sp. RHAY321]
MTTKLEGLVRQATVPLTDAAGTLLGTAFFVASGFAVTVAHVVHEVVDGKVFAPDRQGVLRALSVSAKHPATVAPGIEPYPLPDLAVLVARAGEFEDMPCVLLGRPGTATQLLAIGHSRSIDPRAAFGNDLALLDVEGLLEEQGVDVFKVKQGAVEFGMSGAPVLDREAGLIVGVVKATRGVGKPYGAYVVAAAELQHLEHSVWAQNELHYRTNPAWRAAKAGDFEGPDPVAATLEIVDAVIRDAESRREALPEGVDAEALHQTIWLRRRDVSGTRSGDGVSFRQRWRSERTMSGLTVVSGDPGFGKSWLLAHQALYAARHARHHLDRGGSIDDCVIPVHLTCATLAADNGYGLDVRGLARTLIAATLSHGQADENDVQGYVAVVERALTDGRVLLCVDGLDEMPNGLRSRLKLSLVTLLSLNNTLLMASRPAGLPIIDEIAVGKREDFELVGFSTRETVNFVQAWLRDREEAANSLLAAFADRAELAQLAEVPLLLSFLCRLADPAQRQNYRRATLPQLYHDVTRHLLSGRWHGARSPDHSEAMPDPVLRMRLLAEVLGDLQDSWRGGVEDIPKSDLRAGLRRHREYEAVAATAAVRIATHHESSPTSVADVAEPVLWELLYDGILVEANDARMRPTVRFIHPILRETLLATYFAGLPLDQQLACIDRHRWLDGSWTRVFVAAAGLVTDPAALVAHIVSETGDPWVTQRTLAAQIIVEANDYRDELSAEAVRDAILVATRSPVAFERRRAVDALGILLRSPCRPLREWAREQVEVLDQPTERREGIEGAPHSDIEAEIAHTAVSSLLDVRDTVAVRRAQTLVTSERCPQPLRLRLIAGLVALNTSDAADLVLALLQRPGAGREELEAFLGALRPHSYPAVAAAIRLLHNRGIFTSGRVQVGRALLECGPTGVEAVRATADDRTMNWGLRCRLYADLVRAAVPDVVAPAMRLLASQHPQYDDRAELTLALVEDGVAEAIPAAAAALVNPHVHWTVRESLARALARQGEAGRDLLAAQLDYGGIELDLKVRHVCALVAVHDSRGSTAAVNLHSDSGVEKWIRFKLAETLLRHDATLADEEAFIELATSEEINRPARLEIVAEMVRHALPSAEMVLMSLLREPGDGAYSWPDASRRLAEAGRSGQQCLETVANAPDLDWSVRCDAVLSIEKTSEGVPTPDAVAETVAAMPQVWHNRLILGLARNGLVRDLDEFITVARGQRGGYRIIFEFLQRAAVDLRVLTELLATARELQHGSAVDEAPSASPITLDAALLTELGIEFRSDVEMRQHLGWIYQTLQLRVGAQLYRLMLAEQIEEFQAYVDSNDEEAAFGFIEQEFPEHRAVVRNEFAALKDEIRSGRTVPPPVPDAIRANSLLISISRVSAVLSEWVGAADARRWERWRNLTTKNAELIGSEIALRVLNLSVGLDPNWGRHEAAFFVASRLADGDAGMIFEYSALIDWLKGRLEDDDYRELFYGGMFATMRFADQELGWVYAAVGAEQLEQHQLALHLVRRAGQNRPPGERQYGSSILDQFQLGMGWSDEVTGELRDAYVEGVKTATLSDYERAVEREPESAVRHFALGIALQRVGRQADAVEAYQRAADLEPSAGMRHRALAGALSAVKRHEEALTAISIALDLDRSDHIAHSVRSIVLGRLDRHEEALEAIEQAHRLAPTSPHYLAHVGTAMSRVGRLEEAIEMLREALTRRPKLMEPRFALVEVLTGAERYEEALTEVDVVLQLDPVNARAHYTKGVTLSRAGRDDEADEWLWSATRANPENALYLSGLGLQLHRVGRYSESADALRRAIGLDASSLMSQRVLAQVELALGRETEALAAITAALALDPADPLTHDAHGRMLTRLGRFPEAVAAFAEATRLAPEASWCRANYGEALVLSGRLTDGERELRESIRLGPANAIEAAVLLAIATHQRDPDEAGALARDALTYEDEESVTPFRNRELRSIARLLTGDVDGAVTELRGAAVLWRVEDYRQESLYDRLRSIVAPEAVDALVAAWPQATT